MRALADVPLRQKLLLLALLTSTAVLVAAAGAFGISEWIELRHQARRDLVAQAQALASSLEVPLARREEVMIRSVLETLRGSPRFDLAVLYDASGAAVATLSDGLFTTTGSGPIPADVPLGVQPEGNHLVLFQPVGRGAEAIGTLRLQTTLRTLPTGFLDHLTVTGVVLLGCWLFAFVLAWALEGLVSRPIMALLDTTRRVATERDYSLRTPSPGRDEIGQLVDGHNAMLQEIQSRDAALRRAQEELELRVADRTQALQHEVIERRRIEAALASETERLAVTLRGIGEAVVATDGEGRITLFNPVAEQLSGWSATAAAHQEAAAVLVLNPPPPGMPAEHPVAHVLRTGGSLELGDRALCHAGSGRWRRVNGRVTPIRDAHGRVLGAVLVFQDVTEKLRASEEHLRLSKLESLGELAGGIAHDYNNLLTAILGNVSLARSSPHVHPAITPILEAAEGACARASELTRQLLTFAAGGTPVKQAASLASVIRDTVGFTLRGSKVALHVQCEDPLWPVEIDVGQIAQVLQNLTLNATQAMPDGGHFTIRARNVALGPGHSLPPGRYVHLSFEDTGRGIAPEHLPRVFEPYFTTHKRRSGLGLAVAHSIIRKHDGEITAESEPGRGAVFHVRLPAVRTAAETSSAPPPPSATGPVRVLVMDDEEPILRLLVNVLTDEGYEVATARDGAEAVRLFQAACDEARPFGLVILDLTVPGGVGGLDTLQRLHAIDPAVRAIVSSGYSADEALARHREHGFAGVIPKPYRVADVLEVVREVLSPAPTAP